MFEDWDAVALPRAWFIVTISSQIMFPVFSKISAISVTYRVHWAWLLASGPAVRFGAISDWQIAGQPPTRRSFA
jgi:hypothetical protein